MTNGEKHISDKSCRNRNKISMENGKVCCNCRHNIRSETDDDIISCKCEIDDSWLSYVTVMTYRCRHWSREREESEDKDGITN